MLNKGLTRKLVSLLRSPRARAVEMAQDYGWNWKNELLLYVIHGSLHLVGYDDKNPEVKAVMQEAERRHLLMFGIEHRITPVE